MTTDGKSVLLLTIKMGNFWVKRIGRQISLAFATILVVVMLGSPSLGQIPFLSAPSEAPSNSTFPWDSTQAFPCGKVWCSNVYLYKGDTRLRTALEKRKILTPELILTAAGDKTESSQDIAQQAELRAQLVQRGFRQTINQILDHQTVSTVPFNTNLSFWLPLTLQGLNLPIFVKSLHPWTPKVEIGTQNRQTVIYLPKQPGLGLASQVVVTLTDVDARTNGKTIEQLAKLWRVNIQLSFSNALWGVELDRQHPLLRWQMAGVILGATLLLILGIEIIRVFLRKWNHHLRHKLDVLTKSLAIDPEVVSGKKKDTRLEQFDAEGNATSTSSPDQSRTARQRRVSTKLSFLAPSILLDSSPTRHPRWIFMVWRLISWNLNQLLGLIFNVYDFLNRITRRTQWLSPQFYISEQKRFLRQQTAMKQQRNFCLLLLAQMLIAEVLTFAIGLSIILYIFRETRFFASFLFDKTIFLIAIWVALIFIDKIGAILIDYYLNHWAIEGQAINPNSTRYTLRVSTYSLVLKQATSFVVLVVGGYITMASIGVNPGVLAGAGVFAVAIAVLGRSLVEDLLNGILVLWTDRYAIGDVVDLGGGMAGAVEDITLFITSLRNLDGDSIAIPNSQISAVTNKKKWFFRSDYAVLSGNIHDNKTLKLKLSKFPKP